MKIKLERFFTANGLPKDAMGRKFTLQGQTFILVGINTNKKKFPFVARRSVSKETMGVSLKGMKKAMWYATNN